MKPDPGDDLPQAAAPCSSCSRWPENHCRATASCRRCCANRGAATTWGSGFPGAVPLAFWRRHARRFRPRPASCRTTSPMPWRRSRHCLLRPAFRHAEAPAATLETAGVPLFQTIETYRPRPAALLHGGLLAILWILAALVLIGKGGGVARPFRIGVYSSRPILVPIRNHDGYLTADELVPSEILSVRA